MPPFFVQKHRQIVYNFQSIYKSGITTPTILLNFYYIIIDNTF